MQEAARHLMTQNDLYKLVVGYIAREFDVAMQELLGSSPDQELIQRQGQAQAFRHVLKTLRGG